MEIIFKNLAGWCLCVKKHRRENADAGLSFMKTDLNRMGKAINVKQKKKGKGQLSCKTGKHQGRLNEELNGLRLIPWKQACNEKGSVTRQNGIWDKTSQWLSVSLGYFKKCEKVKTDVQQQVWMLPLTHHNWKALSRGRHVAVRELNLSCRAARSIVNVRKFEAWVLNRDQTPSIWYIRIAYILYSGDMVDKSIKLSYSDNVLGHNYFF